MPAAGQGSSSHTKVPGAEAGAAPGKGWVCKGSATAELLLTGRGSSCREREPGSANTNTRIAENTMCVSAVSQQHQRVL